VAGGLKIIRPVFLYVGEAKVHDRVEMLSRTVFGILKVSASFQIWIIPLLSFVTFGWLRSQTVQV